MKERVVITGSKGTIGTVLREGLKEDYEITPLDLPETDVRNYQELLSVVPGHSAIIHLAWDTKTDNFRSGKINPNNAMMFYNVYRAAEQAKVQRVVMASSVHADRFYGWKRPELIRLGEPPIPPDSPYGAHKVFMESLGRYYSTRGLEVVCIRFGGINPQNKPPNEPQEERAVWFSHKDCISLINTILKAPSIPNNFFVMYGVSNNSNRMHDISNPLNWLPTENAEDFR